MYFYINGYRQEYTLAVVAKNQVTFNELHSNNYDIMFINDKYVHFYPSNYEISIEDKEKQKLDCLFDYDIVEINDKGIGYRLYSSQEGDPSIVITSKCNSNCIMCPGSEQERKNAGYNSREHIERFIEYLPSDLFNLVVTGGEPTLTNNEFIQVMNKIKGKFQSTKVLLLTNGRSMGDVRFFNEFLKVAPNNLRVAIPLHGHNPEIHNKITQTPMSFQQTILGINNLLKAKKEVEIRVVVSKQNCDYLSEISKYIIQYFNSARCVNFVGLEVRGNCALNAKDVYIEYKEAASKAGEAIKTLALAGIDVGLYNFPLCLINKCYWPIAAKSIASYKSKFYQECDLCRVKESCSGIFQASMTLVKPKVYPIR